MPNQHDTTAGVPFPVTWQPILATGWADWWLPANYARHGVDVDRLFDCIFWLTLIIGVAVHLILIAMCIRYRKKKNGAKAVYSHGHAKTEMIWTVAPAIILAVLSFSSIRIWDNFRYSPDFTDPGRAKILVIGQQFKWNVIYPGPDGKFGRYLEFPKPTDPRWPVGANGKSLNFAGISGPAVLPYRQAVSTIARYIDTINPLGKVFTDPDGRDDDYESALGRTMYIPVNRPVEIRLMSKDVIHDFYLPNFRAQLYAVPGMTGKICFTATETSKAVERDTRKTYDLNELPALLEQPQYADLTTDITNPPQIITSALIAKFKSTGITKLTAYQPGYFDIACAQICGLGHYTMQARLVVLSQEEYDAKFPTFPHNTAK